MRVARLYGIYSTALFGAVFAVCLDRLAKAFALHTWRFEPIVITDWLSLVFSKNRFISFSLSLGFDPRWIIIPIIVLLIAVVIFLITKKRLPEAAALSFVCIGAASNAYDRFVYGFVIDYIDIHRLTVLNIADIMITVGVAAFAWISLRASKR